MCRRLQRSRRLAHLARRRVRRPGGDRVGPHLVGGPLRDLERAARAFVTRLPWKNTLPLSSTTAQVSPTTFWSTSRLASIMPLSGFTFSFQALAALHLPDFWIPRPPANAVGAVTSNAGATGRPGPTEWPCA